MRKWMLQSHREDLNRIEPIIRRMNPEMAHKLSIELENLEAVTKAMRDLSRAVDDIQPLEEKDCVSFTEGLGPEDTEVMRAWLLKKANEVQSVYELIPISQHELFHDLSCIAADVYEAALIAEQNAREAAEAAEEAQDA